MDLVGIIGAIGAILVTIGGGIKFMINRYDKKQEKRLEERNIEREEIKGRLTKLEDKVEKERKQNLHLIKMVASCEHPNCQVKKAIMIEIDKADNE